MNKRIITISNFPLLKIFIIILILQISGFVRQCIVNSNYNINEIYYLKSIRDRERKLERKGRGRKRDAESYAIILYNMKIPKIFSKAIKIKTDIVSWKFKFRGNGCEQCIYMNYFRGLNLQA